MKSILFSLLLVPVLAQASVTSITGSFDVASPSVTEESGVDMFYASFEMRDESADRAPASVNQQDKVIPTITELTGSF